MTYEELIVAIAGEAPKLSEAALRVLLQLVATAIETGSAEVKVSKQWIAERTDMCREGVARGVRDLGPFIRAAATNGVATTFELPADWFTPQRSLFAVDTSQRTRHHLPTNQAGSYLQTRQVPANEPGSSRLQTRQVLPTNQAGMPTNQAAPANEPGRSCLFPRQVSEQNQQLSDDGQQIRSDRILSSLADSQTIISQIVARTTITVDLRREADILSQHLRAFYDRHGAQGPVPIGPSDSTLARMLALAPLETLLKRLEEMETEKLGHPRKWVWFLVLFAQDIRGISADTTLTALKSHAERKPPRSAADPLFSQQLINQTAAGARAMR